MPVVITDDILAEAGMTEAQARIEIACRLFQVGKLDQNAARDLAGLDRVAFWSECGKRSIDAIGYTAEDAQQDVVTLERVLGKP